MDQAAKSPKRRNKFAGKEDISRATTDGILSGQIDQLREIARTSDEAATKINESVSILYNKQIPVNTEKLEQLKREFIYEMQVQVKKVKQPSRGLKWYIFMWTITLISALATGYFFQECKKWKEDAAYWYRQYEEIKTLKK